jgi:hypothetical protein
MEMNPKRKILFLIPAVSIVSSVVFAENTIAAEHGHDCTGEGCLVCIQVEAAKCFLKTLRLSITGLFLSFCLAFSVRNHKKNACFIPFLSLVALKVRFNS